MRSRI